MTLEPIIFFDLIFAIFILAIGFAVFAFLYVRLLERLHLVKNQEERLKQQINQKATALLEAARDKAFQIINQANLKTKEIVGKTKAYDEQAKQALEEEFKNIVKDQTEALEKASLQFLTTYQEMLKELKENNINTIKNISKDIEDDVLNEFKDFKDILQRETMASQKIIEAKLEKEYQVVNEEIKAYREQRLKEVDNSIYGLLDKVSEMVLGKAINFETHQELILEALNKAKADILKMK